MLPRVRHTSDMPLTLLLQFGGLWTCKMDEEVRSRSFPPSWLHALEAPPAEYIVPEFQAKSLAEVLLQELPAWLHNYQYNLEAPVDLHRVRPDSGLWAAVLTRERSLASLDVEELRSLHYIPTGGAWAGLN